MDAQGAATHSSNVWGVMFARDEQSVATVAKGEVRIWALPSGQLACRLDGNYYGARLIADGASGFHITFVSYDRGSMQPIRAIRIDGTTCTQTPVPVMAGTTGSYAPVRYVVRAPDGRFLPNEFATPPDSRLTIRTGGVGFVVETPTGTRVESELVPTALDAGTTWYACTATKSKITYHRMSGTGRAEKVGESDADRYGMSACGPLSLSADSTVLLNVGDGAAIDLRRKRVMLAYPLSQSTSVGIDVSAGRMTVGFGNGAVVLDLHSKKPVSRLGGSSTFGYVSSGATWIAVASNLVARPLVELVSPRFPAIVLDDARSRPAADILVASREAEIRAREQAAREAQARDDADRARGRAAFDARQQQLRQIVERMFGPVAMYVTLKQIQYQGAYDFVHVDLKTGDLLILASEGDGVVGYSISDGTRTLTGDRSVGDVSEGFKMVRSTITDDISGSLMVKGRGALVHAFLIRRANVRGSR